MCAFARLGFSTVVFVQLRLAYSKNIIPKLCPSQFLRSSPRGKFAAPCTYSNVDYQYRRPTTPEVTLDPAQNFQGLSEVSVESRHLIRAVSKRSQGLRYATTVKCVAQFATTYDELDALFRFVFRVTDV